MSARIFITRRMFIGGLAGTLVVGTATPQPIPQDTKIVTVACETTHAGRQWVVFNDLPTTIFAFDFDDTFHPFRTGAEYLVAAREVALVE